MIKNRYTMLSSTERRVLWIVLVIAVAFGVFASTVFDTLIGAPNLQYALVNLVPFILLVASVITATLIFFGKKEIGSWILLLSALTSLVVISAQAEGFGIPAAFILLVITLFVPLQLLKGTSAGAALWTGIAGTVGIILLDAFWQGPRVPALQQDVFTAQVASGILGLILTGAVAAQYRTLSFRNKLIILFVAISTIVVFTVSLVANNLMRNALIQQVGQNQQNLAERLAFETGKELESQVETLQSARNQFEETVAIADIAYTGSGDDILKHITDLDEKWRSASDNDFLIQNVIHNTTADKLRKFQAEFPSHVELFITDQYGANIAATNRTSDYYQADEDWWKIAYSLGKGRVYIGQPEFDESSQTYSINIAIPISSKGKVAGILRSTLDVTALIENLQQGSLSGTREIDLRIQNDALLGGEPLAPGELSGLSNVMGKFGEITYKGKPSLVSQQRVFSSADSSAEEAVSQLGWSVIVHQDVNTALQPVQQQTRTITLVAVIITILVGLLGILASQRLAAPIITLTEITSKVAEGDLSIRAQIPTQDEIGELANSFNLMTRQLQDTLGGLERRVAERTADVELARLMSERRAQELQAISEVSKTISTEQRLEILLPLVTRLVSEKFDFYHVGIFFVDDTQQFAVLQASNSEGGKRMIERGHRLEVGQTGIVGNVAQTGKPRIALDVGADAVFFSNPDLPNTRSEMALPLNVRGKTIGVLDVQSVKPGAFTESDANTLSILADQVAIAIDNARLFGQSQDALNEVQKLNRQYQSQEWSQFMQKETQIGYRQSLIGGKPLETLVESDEIQKAIQNGEVVVSDGKNEKSQPSISIPVKLRGQTIGVLNIKAPTKNRKWNQDEINLAQAVSDRLALALDNARLLQDSQRRAAKEQKIGEVTAKIGASINMRNVLQTAVEELGRALPGSEVVIQFDKPEEQR